MKYYDISLLYFADFTANFLLLILHFSIFKDFCCQQHKFDIFFTTTETNIV